jgi:SAM-dependent methyltransferase
MTNLCIVCGGLPASFLRCPDFLTSGGEFSIVRCTACGFLWTAEAPGAGEIHGFYGAPYEQSIHPPLAHPLLRKIRMEIQTRVRAKMVERQSRKRRGVLLDIGCGDGDFIRAMRGRGWSATGVELTGEKRDRLARRGVMAIGPGQWPSLPAASVDAVTLWHSLEHLHEPLDVLRHVRRLLKPEGICVIAVPNAGSPQAKRDGSRWFGYDVPRHLWHFTTETIARLLAQAGFAVREFRPTRIDGFTITLLMMHVQRRKDWPHAVIVSFLRDVLMARTADDASCMMCIAV